MMNQQKVDIFHISDKLVIAHVLVHYSQYFPRFSHFAVIICLSHRQDMRNPKNITAHKIKFFIKGFFSKCD